MSDWQDYPANYRETEVRSILNAIRAGESINLIGLSGAGKSNLLGYLANRWPLPGENDDIHFILLDCNALPAYDAQTLLRQLYGLLGGESGSPADGEFQLLNRRIAEQFGSDDRKISLLLDRYEVIEQTDPLAASNNLRALRDAHKYRLTFLFASRRPLDPESELAKLFYANSVWLGTMSRSDAEWNITRYARRRDEDWPADVADTLIELSAGYPAFLRGLCEAYSQLNSLDREALTGHPAVQRRVKDSGLTIPKRKSSPGWDWTGLPCCDPQSLNSVPMN